MKVFFASCLIGVACYAAPNIDELISIAAANPSSDLAVVMNAYTALPADQQGAALVQLEPVVDGALTQLSFASAQQFQDLWMRHMGNGRCTLASSCSVKNSNGWVWSKKERADAALRKQGGCYSELNCANVPNQFEVWADGFGYIAQQDERNGTNGYNSQTYGAMLGFQAPLHQLVSLGVAIGYSSTDISRRDHSRLQTYDGTLYVSFNPTNWYLDGAFSFDYNQYRDNRYIRFGDIDRNAQAGYGGQQYTALLAAGYRYYSPSCIIVTPLASLQYSYLHVGGYHEFNAGDIALHVNVQRYNFLEPGLGLKLAREFQTRKGAFVPEVHAMWFYDVFGDPMDLTTTFSGVASEAGATETDGPANEHNWGDVGVGLTYYSCAQASVEFVYNFEFSDTYRAHEGLIKLSKRF